MSLLTVRDRSSRFHSFLCYAQALLQHIVDRRAFAGAGDAAALALLDSLAVTDELEVARLDEMRLEEEQANGSEEEEEEDDEEEDDEAEEGAEADAAPAQAAAAAAVLAVPAAARFLPAAVLDAVAMLVAPPSRPVPAAPTPLLPVVAVDGAAAPVLVPAPAPGSSSGGGLGVGASEVALVLATVADAIVNGVPDMDTDAHDSAAVDPENDGTDPAAKRYVLAYNTTQPWHPSLPSPFYASSPPSLLMQRQQQRPPAPRPGPRPSGPLIRRDARVRGGGGGAGGVRRRPPRGEGGSQPGENQFW